MAGRWQCRAPLQPFPQGSGVIYAFPIPLDVQDSLLEPPACHLEFGTVLQPGWPISACILQWLLLTISSACQIRQLINCPLIVFQQPLGKQLHELIKSPICLPEGKGERTKEPLKASCVRVTVLLAPDCLARGSEGLEAAHRPQPGPGHLPPCPRPQGKDVNHKA